jgi:SlyX protein
MKEDRLIDLETRIAFQEQAIKDLNEVIYQHQKTIDRLTAVCDSLVKQNKDFSASDMEGPANEKPPHY